MSPTSQSAMLNWHSAIYNKLADMTHALSVNEVLDRMDVLADQHVCVVGIWSLNSSLLRSLTSQRERGDRAPWVFESSI